MENNQKTNKKTTKKIVEKEVKSTTKKTVKKATDKEGKPTVKKAAAKKTATKKVTPKKETEKVARVETAPIVKETIVVETTPVDEGSKKSPLQKFLIPVIIIIVAIGLGLWIFLNQGSTSARDVYNLAIDNISTYIGENLSKINKDSGIDPATNIISNKGFVKISGNSLAIDESYQYQIISDAANNQYAGTFNIITNGKMQLEAIFKLADDNFYFRLPEALDKFIFIEGIGLSPQTNSLNPTNLVRMNELFFQMLKESLVDEGFSIHEDERTQNDGSKVKLNTYRYTFNENVAQQTFTNLKNKMASNAEFVDLIVGTLGIDESEVADNIDSVDSVDNYSSFIGLEMNIYFAGSNYYGFSLDSAVDSIYSYTEDETTYVEYLVDQLAIAATIVEDKVEIDFSGLATMTITDQENGQKFVLDAPLFRFKIDGSFVHKTVDSITTTDMNFNMTMDGETIAFMIVDEMSVTNTFPEFNVEDALNYDELTKTENNLLRYGLITSLLNTNIGSLIFTERVK